MKSCITFWFFIIWATATRQVLASEVYNLDFTSPETGNYQTVFGHPAIQSSIGPFADALIFQAVTEYEQIRLDVGNVAPQYDIQCDLMMHNLLGSQYAFSIILDYDLNQNQYQSVSFHGGLNSIQVFSPSPFGVGMIGGFSNDQVYHFGIALDFDAELWSLEIDGNHSFSSQIDGSNLQSIRFSMAPWIGGALDDPGNYAAIDNVVVTAIPEPSTLVLIAVEGLAAMVFLRHTRVNSMFSKQSAPAPLREPGHHVLVASVARRGRVAEF